MSDKDYWKKVYDQAEPTAVKYLHSNGTIDENPGAGGGGITVESLSITENGTYIAPAGKAYSPVIVNVPTVEDEVNTLWTIGKFHRLLIAGINGATSNEEYIATLTALGASGNVWQYDEDWGQRIQGTLTFSKNIKILQSINAEPPSGDISVVLKVGTITSVEVRYGEWNSGNYRYIIYHYSDGTVSDSIDLNSWSTTYKDEEDKLMQIKD